MDQRDEELDRMLEPLRGEAPTPLEMQRWMRALNGAAAKERGLGRASALRLFAACVVGAVLGALLFAKLRPVAAPGVCAPCASQMMAAGESSNDATIERIHIKLD